MADDITLQWKTTSLIRLVDPEDESTVPSTLITTVAGATCSFKVYDVAKDEVLFGAEAGGQTVLSVTGAGSFVVGDVVEVDLDAGTVHDAGAVTAVDPALGTITVTTALASAAAAGRRVRVRLGPSVSMAQYGVAALGSDTWGFVGTLAHNHPGLVKDLHVAVEITLVGPAAAYQRLDVLCATVQQVADCGD